MVKGNAEAFRQDFAPEEGERTEPQRHASGLEKPKACQAVVDKTVVVQGRVGRVVRPAMKPKLLKRMLDAFSEWLERRIQPGVKQIDHPRPVVSRENDV